MGAPQPVFDTVERARGRWPQILRAIGIEQKFLSNKHGPCPLCGGVDRYRFDNRDGAGTYFCNQCGPGAGIILVRKFLKCDHATACREVDKIIGESTSTTSDTRHQAPANDSGKRRAAIERLLAEATDRAVVDRYLAKRGLAVCSPALQGHRALPFYDDVKRKVLGYYPAMIAPILGHDGSLQSAIRIYDAALTPRKKMLPPVDTIRGGAVRLFEPGNGVLAVTEGVETGLAVREMFRHPVWATLSDNGLMSFEPPASVNVLHIFGDHDASYVGQAAAYALAKKTYAGAKKEGRTITIEVWIPEIADTDWLDVLNARKVPA